MTGIKRKLAPIGAPFVAVTMSGLAGVAPSAAQGTAADYERARSLKTTYENAAGVVAEPATWIEKTSRFWYRRAVPGGNEFVVVDAATKQKQPAFDHARLASALSVATGRSVQGADAPICPHCLHEGPARPGRDR